MNNLLTRFSAAMDKFGNVLSGGWKNGIAYVSSKEGRSRIVNIMRTASAVLVGMTIVVGAILYYNIKNTGYTVNYDGKFLGYVRDKQEVSDVILSVEEGLKAEDPSIVLDNELTFERVLVNSEKLTAPSTIGEEIKSDLYEEFTTYAIYVNGVEKAVVATEDDAKKAIEGAKKYFGDQEAKKGSEVLAVAIKDDIKVESKISGVSGKMSVQAAVNSLAGIKPETKTNIVRVESKIKIASRSGDLGAGEMAAAVSEDETNTLKPVETKSVPENTAPLNVEITSNVTDTEKIAFDTQYTSDNSLFKGQTKVVKDGEYGIKKIVSRVTKLNGREVSREVVDTQVEKQPVTQVVAKGTKNIVGSGSFSWPASGHVTYGFGYRADGFHSGMDICAPQGTPIYASDGGTVIQAGWYYGYGNLVIIDHGNGFTTYYGHCSAIYVNKGDSVARGQKIAAIGHTGDASANHVHFEIRVNGAAKNPAVYLK